ncbi:uncharacterized protein LOC129304964 isoform X5 [Prosopis cineraria]|uniref:uncharacterized protein LOC129304964 isoform X5 n=1 Tax=Prosopis cineraria TaxID=364024 RepID=UPI00241044C9|nr:uncharacterized protein LOC129304964 isoform X5 [Prosopis cineraria]
MCLESLKHALLDTISRLDHQHNFFCSAGWSLFRGRSFYKTLVSLVDPPYFQRAQREKMARSLSQACANESSDLNKSLNAACASQKKESSTYGHESTALSGVDVEHATTIDSESNRNDMNMRTHDESECLSDIDDLEIDLYLHNEEERRYKKIIWEKLNRDYLKEQTAKEAAAKRGFDGLLASRELGTAFAAKSQKNSASVFADDIKVVRLMKRIKIFPFIYLCIYLFILQMQLNYFNRRCLFSPPKNCINS